MRDAKGNWYDEQSVAGISAWPSKRYQARENALGEPFYSGNDLVLIRLINIVKETYPEIKIYTWTGYTYEELYQSSKAGWFRLLQSTDYLIDGPYIQEQRDITLRMRGSRNQRILKLDDEGKIIEELF